MAASCECACCRLLNSLQNNGNRRPFRYPLGGRAKEYGMFIAMNRFKVHKGSERDFEQVWLTRQTHLEQVPGFMAFHLLKGPEKDDQALRFPQRMALTEALRGLDAVGSFPQSPCRRWCRQAALSRPSGVEGFTVLQEVK